MSADYFAEFATVRYEVPDSTNDLAYRWYDKDRVVLGKRMEDHLRFAVCMWHTFCWPGSDVFGAGTFTRPWLTGPNDAVAAKAKREAALAFVEKLDVPFYCFHDVDVMAEAESITDLRKSFAQAVDHLEELQTQHGRKLLWGTANLFGHPRYMAGAATNPDPEVWAWGASQVRDALEATHVKNLLVSKELLEILLAGRIAVEKVARPFSLGDKFGRSIPSLIFGCAFVSLIAQRRQIAHSDIRERDEVKLFTKLGKENVTILAQQT